MHLDLDQPISLTGFAPAALDVKREPPRLISACLRFRQPREPIPDRREGPCICGRVGTRRAPDRTLVNIDHLVEMFEPIDRLTRTRRLPRAIQPHRSGFEQRLNGQG